MRIEYTLLLIVALVSVHAQDTRRVSEPKIPSSCAVLTASLTAHGTTLAEADENKLDTRRIQQALDQCPAGKAVELKSNGGHDAFLSGPLELRRGVTLFIARDAVV